MRHRGRTRVTMRPGDPGTKRHQDDWGDRLVAVRCRYDDIAWRRYTTVEIVVDDRPWTPERHLSDPDRLVGLRIGFAEEELRRRVKMLGAKWDSDERLWWLPLHLVVSVGLEERIGKWGEPRGRPA